MTLIDLNKYKQLSKKGSGTGQAETSAGHSQLHSVASDEKPHHFNVPEALLFRNPFKAKNFIESFSFALAGLHYIFRTEKNFRMEGYLALLAIAAGAFLHIAMVHWLTITVMIGFVLTIETINTVIEYLVDLFTQGEFDMRAKIIKDMSAGACVIASVTAAIVGICIFIPYIRPFFHL